MPSTVRRIAAIFPQELEYSSRLMKGAIDYVKKHRNVALVDLPYRVDAPNSIRLDRPLPFDAAFIWATPEARWVEDLLAASLPLVGASGDWPSEQVPYISFDGKAVEERAIEHLARRKPEILLHLEFLITGVPLIENRTRRFCDLAKRRGFPVKSFEIFRLGDPEDNSLTRRMPLQGKAAKRLKSLLRGLSRPAAIWCGDDWLGLRVCEAAVAFGLRIPEDVAVLGLGDFAGAEGGHPSLSSIPLPGETIAYHALTILDQRLSGKNDFPDRLLVSPPLWLPGSLPLECFLKIPWGKRSRSSPSVPAKGLQFARWPQRWGFLPRHSRRSSWKGTGGLPGRKSGEPGWQKPSAICTTRGSVSRKSPVFADTRNRASSATFSNGRPA